LPSLVSSLSFLLRFLPSDFSKASRCRNWITGKCEHCRPPGGGRTSGD
jgi:hypothetical protein